MWTKRLRARTDDTEIPRKKYKASVQLQNCSQKQDDHIKTSTNSKKPNKQIIIPHHAVSDIDQNLIEDIKPTANASHTSPEGSQISSPDYSPSVLVKITPTVLEKLLVTPEQNNEIKISEAGDENKDYDVVVELVDHTVDCVCIHESQTTKACEASDEQTTVLNNDKNSEETEDLPDLETSQDADKDHSASELVLEKNVVQGDIMSSNNKDLSTSLPKNDISTGENRNKTAHCILTRSRSRKAANMTDSAEPSISNQQIEKKSENSKINIKQSSAPQRRVVRKKKNISTSFGGGEVYNIPKFRPWPHKTRWQHMGIFKRRAPALIKNDHCKLKSIFLDSSLQQNDQKWNVQILDKGQLDNDGLEWNMYQLSQSRQIDLLQASVMNDIAQKLNHKQMAGAKILNLSKEIYYHLVSEGLQPPVVEVIVHHVKDKSAPATAWLIRAPNNLPMLPPGDDGVSEKGSEENKE